MTNSVYSIYDILGAFLTGLLLSYLLTPLFKVVARKFRFLDHPELNRKSHRKPIPLLGGLAIYTAFFLSTAFIAEVNIYLAALLGGSAVLIIFGLVDDKLGILPSAKIAGQLIAALIVIRVGLKVDAIRHHHLAMLFTIFWIVGITNAFNLLDNLNGLSSGIAGIAGVFFGLIAFNNGQIFVSIVSFALAGSCFGFLKHNFPKAHIFMGDAGSMFIGFVLSCIAIIGTWKTQKVSISLSLPILILSYPIFDTVLVTVIRLIEGRSIFEGGKDHSSHILSLLGFKKKRAVLLIYAICVFMGLSAYIMSISNVQTGFVVMIVAYLFLFSLGIYLLSVRRAKVRKKRRG